jgi:hypothetical protein
VPTLAVNISPETTATLPVTRCPGYPGYPELASFPPFPPGADITVKVIGPRIVLGTVKAPPSDKVTV